MKVPVDTEAVEIYRQGKRVRARGPDGESWYAYDPLILAQGGNPMMPTIAGIDSPNVFHLWTVHETWTESTNSLMITNRRQP